MKGLAALLACMVATLAPAAAPGAPADACRHTDVVFYTTDTQRLALELAKPASACTDYYLSVTPTGAGLPRGGAVLATLRSLGPRFHAMAEVRPDHWAAKAATVGWYAAGVEVRRQMRLAGYDTSLGDTWALNEVGAPSGSAFSIDVLKGDGTARSDVADFIRGLYTGDDAVASAGLVFAANPRQVTTELAQYGQDLKSWYADSTFWNGIAPYVRFWAQETYADARNWGVPGTTLAERVAHLDDYFLHGLRLAQREDGLTAAARAFLARTYTPLANASYPHSFVNPTTGVGFGFTNVPLNTMLHFASTQTFAMRAGFGDRLGYAVVPVVGHPAAETLAVHARVANAIRDSESAPLGACGASGEWCDSSVANATFNDAWKVFANTLEGSAVAVEGAPGVSVTYAVVTARGSTWVETSPATTAPPARFQLRPGAVEYVLATTAGYTSPIEVCVSYDAVVYDGYVPHLFRLADGGWIDVTTSTRPGAVCGTGDTLGRFAVFAADPTPPVILSHVAGPLGRDGWYIGDATVTWSVSDPQSSLTTSGCGETRITVDTPGIAITCSATSDGGTTTATVTVKRDATAPTVACTPTPSSLWPPNGKLAQVDVGVSVGDATSGPDGFLLTHVTAGAGDAAGFAVGTADVSGLLRAERAGTEGERVYELTYTARDHAGNSAGCVARVVVDHDRRG